MFCSARRRFCVVFFSQTAHVERKTRYGEKQRKILLTFPPQVLWQMFFLFCRWNEEIKQVARFNMTTLLQFPRDPSPLYQVRGRSAKNMTFAKYTTSCGVRSTLNVYFRSVDHIFTSKMYNAWHLQPCDWRVNNVMFIVLCKSGVHMLCQLQLLCFCFSPKSAS